MIEGAQPLAAADSLLVDGAREIDLGPALADLATLGYARLGPVLSADGVRALGARVDELMTRADPDERLFYQHDSPTGRYEDLSFGRGWQGPSLDYRKIEKLELDPLFREWIGNPLFERIARRLVDGPVSLYRAVLFTKSARGGTALPWHQDGGAFWGVDRMPELQIWTALDDCTVESGCVEVLPGSHLGGLASPQGGVIPDAALRRADAGARAVPVEARAGEGLLIHNHLWHRSGVNRSGKRRATFSVCLMSAATRCLRKKRAPRKFAVIFDGDGVKREVLPRGGD